MCIKKNCEGSVKHGTPALLHVSDDHVRVNRPQRNLDLKAGSDGDAYARVLKSMMLAGVLNLRARILDCPRNQVLHNSSLFQLHNLTGPGFEAVVPAAVSAPPPAPLSLDTATTCIAPPPRLEHAIIGGASRKLNTSSLSPMHRPIHCIAPDINSPQGEVQAAARLADPAGAIDEAEPW
ncbi:hypothetical protein FIBSPDRAFT_883795 [Athelia psychrophila]|uniref:Uncharacterized protein n=1 Tax=Athelia psychrophila TaxID=1759441 RepID=A0A166TIL4_9AGAM|nr:hypothetical protein FIBSPDRAFT_883795 [Fibularhizoctonia sp. CBS 109695]